MLKSLFSPRVVDSRASAGLLVLRLVAGSAMAIHGWGKMQSPFGWMGPDAPIPGFFQFLAAISEFGGGIAWVLGLLVPLASLGMISTMAVAVYTHVSKGDPFVGMQGSWEPAGGYLAVAIMFLLVGPGRFSVDSLIFGKGATAGDGDGLAGG